MLATPRSLPYGLSRPTLAAAGLLLLVTVLSPTAQAAPATEERLIGMNDILSAVCMQ